MIRFRGDVEGLRGVAVLLVVLAHLEVPGFRGGFFGVDVFFVISGYLITSLLAAEYAKKAEAHGGRGSISIRGFYARRARRILPAALTVIVAVVAASDVLLNELRVAQIRRDAVWAALFGSNVNFIRQASDYFAQGLVGNSPFQHYWSLAVEEQFYVVWPALFLVVARLGFFGASLRWRARVATAITAIGAGSLTWSIVATAHQPAGAYFSTFTRAWELALGALVGIATTGATRLPRRLAGTASAAGVGLLVAACVVIGGRTPFPGAVALLPTSATAVLLVGGLADRAPLPNRALCLAPLRFLGRISYSVYLWHWPLVVFAADLYPTMSTTPQMRLLILLMTLAVATASFYLVERPGRRIGVRARSDRRPTHERPRGRNLATAMCGACVLAAAFVGLAAIHRENVKIEIAPAEAALISRTAHSSPVVVTPERTARRAPTYVSRVSAWQGMIRAGLSLRELPASLRPLSPHLVMVFPPPCIHGLKGKAPGECIVGNPTADHVAVLDGDSHAEMFRSAVWRAFDPKAWSIHIFVHYACGWAGSAESDLLSAAECKHLQARDLSRIRALRPDVLLLSEHLVVMPFRSRTDIAASLAAFTRAAKKTIVLGHTPLPQSWDTCLVGVDISRCFTALDATFWNDMRVEKQLATQAGATFVDTSTWICVRAGVRTVCPPVIDGVPVFGVTTHIGPEFDLKLIPIVRGLLLSAGVNKPEGALRSR